MDLPEPGSETGVVVIGRNEGARLLRCLTSLMNRAAQIVYVDSGSTDDSPRQARDRGLEVVELDMSVPFSAARARNAGFERLQQLVPTIRWVQFVDGDCEVQPDWLPAAQAYLESHPDWAVVCGRRRERFPEHSVFNQLCDVEWDTPIGEASACGGDFLARASAFAEVGGFNPTVIAGEEPELCHRLRARGHRIFRVDHEMTLHDAGMTNAVQWWRRSARAGYAFALVSALHFRSERRLWVKEVLSIVAWANWWIPIAVLALTYSCWILVALGLYPLLWLKTYRYFRGVRGLTPRIARLYSLSCVAGKFAEMSGVARAWRDLVLGRSRMIIEYKGPR